MLEPYRWAVIRRRSVMLREFDDAEEEHWEERLDTVSGDSFFWCPAGGDSSWQSPPVPQTEKNKNDLDDLDEGDRVLFRWGGVGYI